jgi:lysophospholipase L1-like esterase
VTFSTRTQAATQTWQGNGACRLLIFGDSLAASWSAPPPAGWRQAVVGTPGARAGDLVPDARIAIATAQPHAVLVLAGSNDARDAALWPWGDHVARAANAVAAIARAGQTAGARVVVADLLSLGPQPWWRALLIGNRQGRAMAAITARLALPAGTQRLPVARLLAGRGGIDPAYRSDHLHYAPAGYARLATGLAPLLQDACADLGVG